MTWAAVILIAGCGSKKAGKSDELGSSDGSRGAELQVPRVRAPYVIPSAGVHFDPPVSWDPDRIEVVTLSGEEASAAQPGVDYSVSFDYKAEQPAHHNAPLLKLYVVRRAQWDRESRRAPGEVIDSTGDWVYIASLPKDNPYRADLLDADQFNSMRVNMDDVHNAFSPEKGGPTDTSLRAESGSR